MSTVQDPRKKWLATGSLLTVWWRMLVSGAELAPCLQALAVPCLPLCLRGGRTLYSGRLALLLCFGECARGDHVVLELFKDHGIWSHHLMENRKTVETVTDFIFLGSKITADGDCSHERKALTDLGSILKSRDIAGKGLSTQSYGFPVDIDGHDS